MNKIKYALLVFVFFIFLNDSHAAVSFASKRDAKAKKLIAQSGKPSNKSKLVPKTKSSSTEKTKTSNQKKN